MRAAPLWPSRVEVAAVPGGVDARTRVAPRCETFEAHPASRAVVLCGPSAGVGGGGALTELALLTERKCK